MKAKFLSQQEVFQGGMFSVKEDSIEYENGVLKKHLNVYRSPAISVFPLTSSYEVYLIKQYRYLLEKPTLEGVAGMVEKSENPLETARRELKEEAGITARHWEEIFRLDLAGSFIKAKAHIFLAKDLEIGEQSLDEDEKIEVVKLPLDEAVQRIYTGEICTSSSVVGILLLDRLRRDKRV